jgi:hypothetical protein
MNTANLQLEGFALALAALTRALRDKGLMSAAEIDKALEAAEQAALSDTTRTEHLSDANQDSILFPIRLLRVYNGEGRIPSFTDAARYVGVTKPPHDKA